MARWHSFTRRLLLFGLAGCAAGRAAEDGPLPERQRNQITAEELDRVQFTNAHDLVETLRPTWLVDRGGPLMVYVDEVRMGGRESLRQIPAANVAEVRYLTPIQASARFGRGHEGGAILVTTRRG
jgi:hypothetical protein